MENKIKKLKWKHRILLGIGLGILHFVLLYITNPIFDAAQSLNSLLFQSVFMAIFGALAFPYFVRRPKKSNP